MQIIKLDISNKGVQPLVYAKQGDVGRKFQAMLTDNGEDYPVPEGAQLSVWYTGPSGEGNYSAIGEQSAFQVEGSTVTVEMIAQMLGNQGDGTMCLMLHGADGTQLGLWNIPYTVELVPGIDSPAAVQHYTALSETAALAADSAARAEAAAEKLVVDYSLSKSGYAADAANTGGRLRRMEKLIWENQLPIQNGGTGAATAAQALANLGLTATAEELNCMTGATGNIQTQLNDLRRWGKSVNNTDMNTVKTTGFYFGYTGMTNAAVNTISVWEVIAYSNDWGVQRQTVINNDGTSKTYERCWYGGSYWTAWKMIIDSSNWKDYLGGSTEGGMIREFSKDVEADNLAIFTTPGALSYFYVLTVKYYGSYYSLTVDWKGLQLAGGSRQFGVVAVNAGTAALYNFKASINSEDSTVTFDAGVGKIVHVCGYY